MVPESQSGSSKPLSNGDKGSDNDFSESDDEYVLHFTIRHEMGHLFVDPQVHLVMQSFPRPSVSAAAALDAIFTHVRNERSRSPMTTETNEIDLLYDTNGTADYDVLDIDDPTTVKEPPYSKNTPQADVSQMKECETQ